MGKLSQSNWMLNDWSLGFFLTFLIILIEELSFSDSFEDSLFTFFHKLLTIIKGLDGLFKFPFSSEKTLCSHEFLFSSFLTL